MKNPGIYILTSPSGKQYVGLDINLPNRVQDHLLGRSFNCPAIHGAVKKHGAESFSVEIIPYPSISYKALRAVECWYITKLNTKSPNGYNLTGGGDGIFDPSDETRLRMSISSTGKKHSAKTRLKMSVSSTGMRHTQESRRKISIAHLGKKRPLEDRRKISEGKLGMSQDRLIFLIKFYKGFNLSYRKISRILQISRPTIRKYAKLIALSR